MADSRAPVRRGGLISPAQRAAVEGPLKHVIAEYKHQAQTVTCVCGWHGSTAVPDPRRSEWAMHVAANRR